MDNDPADTDAIQTRLQTILRETREVADQLPEPLTLDSAISELEDTLELVAHLESQENQDE